MFDWVLSTLLMLHLHYKQSSTTKGFYRLGSGTSHSVAFRTISNLVIAFTFAVNHQFQNYLVTIYFCGNIQPFVPISQVITFFSFSYLCSSYNVKAEVLHLQNYFKSCDTKQLKKENFKNFFKNRAYLRQDHEVAERKQTCFNDQVPEISGTHINNLGRMQRSHSLVSNTEIDFNNPAP